jgi:hypothetical protein
MRLLRHPLCLRALVGLLLAGLLPAALGWPAAGAAHPDEAVRADWLRAQVRTTLSAEAEAAVERALSAAHEADAASLPAFVAAFADAYVAPEAASEAAVVPSLADLFAVADVQPEALWRVLENRAHQLGGVALPVRLVQAATSALIAPPADRSGDASFVAMLARAAVLAASSVKTDGAVLSDRVVVALRTLFSARPLGP